ncbi:hypothetical protein ACLM5H_11525 [Fredinandcohnia humi]
MNHNQVEAFEQFLLESFSKDVSFRELRLSQEEVQYIQKNYPRASVRKSPVAESSDGKAWYEVELFLHDRAVLFEDTTKLQIELLQQENQRLVKELEELKHSLKVVSK